jgi:putative ubiquitin-RnfH superfamily antitoxin RatB of RatAB toxin-antitoxin module
MLFMEIEVAYATPDKQILLSMDVPVSCTVAEAISLSGIREEFPDMELDPKAVGIFSRKVSMDHELKEGDRVEIYRPLLADPKEMRKQRARADSAVDITLS